MRRLNGETFFRVEGSLAHPSSPRRANFSYISGKSVANRSHDKQTVGLPRGVACLAVTLLVGPTFLQPGQISQDETIGACATAFVCS